LDDADANVEEELMPKRKICFNYMHKKCWGGGPGQMCTKGGGYHPYPHERDELQRQRTLQDSFMGA
jgi:hypothetical protein